MLRQLRAISLGVVLSVLSACGSPTSETPIPTGTISAQVENTTSMPTPQAQTSTNTPILTAETRDILDLGSEALAKMDNFRMHLTFTYDGTDTENTSQKGEVELNNTYWRSDTKDRHLTLYERDLVTDDAMGIELFQFGGKNYSYSHDDTRGQICSTVITDVPSGDERWEESKANFQPNIFIAGVRNARMLEQGVPINGVLTDHYVFDTVDFGVFTSVQGDIWLAQSHDASEEFIVRYTGEAVGQTDLSGFAFTGTIRWAYQIEDINQLTGLELPEVCTTIRMGIPIPEQADVQSNKVRSLIFNSPQSIADLAAFFSTNLDQIGWTLEDNLPNDESWFLTFGRGNTKLNVRISQSRTYAVVVINQMDNPDTSSVNDLPLPASADGDMLVNGLRQFRSSEPSVTIATFYTQALSAAGWEQQTDQSGWGRYSIGFTRESHWLWIDIIPDDQGGSLTTILDETAL